MEVCAIQRHITPENVWKVQAVKIFLKEEMTDAKEIQWRFVGESTIGMKILRKGTTKMVSELNDICTAMKSLSEKRKSSNVFRNGHYGITNTYNTTC